MEPSFLLKNFVATFVFVTELPLNSSPKPVTAVINHSQPPMSSIVGKMDLSPSAILKLQMNGPIFVPLPSVLIPSTTNPPFFFTILTTPFTPLLTISPPQFMLLKLMPYWLLALAMHYYFRCSSGEH